jgi:hypothetical protein
VKIGRIVVQGSPEQKVRPHLNKQVTFIILAMGEAKVGGLKPEFGLKAINPIGKITRTIKGWLGSGGGMVQVVGAPA